MAGSLTIDNVTVTVDSTHAKEVKGSKCTLLFTRAGAITTAAYLLAGEVQTVAGVKGMVMPRNGSITGVTVYYNVTIDTGETDLIVAINGASAIVESLSSDVDEHTFVLTQARGTDPFNADDIILARIGVLGGEIRSIVVAVEVMLDD